MNFKKHLSQKKIINVFILCISLNLIGIIGCKKGAISKIETEITSENTIDNTSNSDFPIPLNANGIATTYNANNFTNGILVDNTIINPLQLKNLGGGFIGNPIAVSNNPESFTGDGYLFKNPLILNSINKYKLSNTFGYYFYHQNKSGVTKYLHIFVTNPTSNNVNYSFKGNIYTSSQFSGNGGKGWGPSYKTSADFLDNKYNFSGNNKIITPYTSQSNTFYASVAIITLKVNEAIDGRLEFSLPTNLNSANSNLNLYMVISSSNSISNALTVSQNNILAAGNFTPESANDFGRENGVYGNEMWSGITTLNLPAQKAFIGLSLNTNNKFAISPGIFYQDQNTSALALNGNSATKSYGNYGQKYNIKLSINNNTGLQRRFRLFLASNLAGNFSSPSFTYHGLIKINGVNKEVYNTGKNPRTIIGDYIIGNAKTNDVNINFIVPGLITTNQQLIIEVIE